MTTSAQHVSAVSGLVSGRADRPSPRRRSATTRTQRIKKMMSGMFSGVGVANDCRNPDGYSSRSASTGATLDARSAGSNDAASTVARDMAAAISSVRGSPGAMP